MGRWVDHLLVTVLSTPGSKGGRVSASHRVCLLTGAGGTLGTAFCRRFATRYQIVAVVRSRKPSEILMREYEFNPLLPDARRLPRAPIFEIAADLTHPGAVEGVVATTLAEFGRIDVLVNAAAMAVWGNIRDGHVVETALEQVFLNALVPLQLAAEVANQCWADQPDENRKFNRNIVNVSSSAGVYVYPDRGQSVYAASKAALNHVTCHLAHEFETIGIRANALAPDAFPYVVPTEVVAAHIEALDEGLMTGEVVVLPAPEDHDR
jgi:NAD(P)-dependent dehydrogenase (short-subunit alcohol dehydrogenase family)